MTRVFYDTEFLENGKTIGLISIGMVAEDGREYYAVNSGMPVHRISRHWWLMKNVVPHLPLLGEVSESSLTVSRRFDLDTTSLSVKPHWVIANEVRAFLQGFDYLELWAWYGAYDHVALAQLWGPMSQLPVGIPMWTNDIQQLADQLGVDLPEQPGGEHDALEDARFNQVRHQYLMREVGNLADRIQKFGVYPPEGDGS